MRSKGTPANAEDRDLRKRAHACFDPLWQRVAARDDIGRSKARSRAYSWLSEQLAISPEDCHIGMMHGNELHLVILCCTPPFGLPGTSKGADQ